MHKLTLPLVLLVVLALVLVLFGTRLYQVVPVGQVAVATVFGSVRANAYPEGLHVPVNPLYQWYLYDVRQKTHKEIANIASQDQLQTELHVSVQYRLIGEEAPTIEIERVNQAVGSNPSDLKLQALQAISKDPAAKVYFLNGDSPTPLALMHLGEDLRPGRP